MTAKPFKARTAAFGIAVTLTFACCAALFSEEIPLDAKTAVELYRASVDQIRTVEADCYDPVAGPDWTVGPNADRDGESNPIHTSYHWYRDLLTEKEYLKGKWPEFTAKKTFDSYEDVTIGFNGDMLYRYSISHNSGTRIKGKYDQYGQPWFNVGISPLGFLGMERFATANRTLLDVLEENADHLGFLRLKDGPSLTNDILLSCNYEDGGRSLTVILDGEHGYLPKFWITKRLPEHTVGEIVYVKRFTEAAPGIWFPTRMQREAYYTDDPLLADGIHFANGMTLEEVNALPEEELEKIAPELGFLTVPLGTAVVRVNPDTLKINRPFDESFLSLEKFPDKMMIWDDVRKIGYKVGRFDDPDLETAPDDLPEPADTAWEEEADETELYPGTIEIDGGPNRDLGIVRAGSQQKIPFVLKNKSTQRIIFGNDITGTCGTMAELSKPSLEPGESCEFTVTLSSRNVYLPGQKVTVRIHTAEPKGGVISVSADYTVYKKWSVSHQDVRVRKPQGMQSVEEVVLSRNGDLDLSVDDIQKSSDDISVDVSPFDKKGEAVIKIGHTLPPAPSKEKENVTLKISGAEEPEIKIGLFYTSLPDIAATPKSLLVYTDGEDPVSREILIESVRETEITAVSTESEGLSFEYGNERSAKHTIRLTVDPARFPAKAYREKATVHVKDAEGNTGQCVIPIYPVRKHVDSEDPDPKDTAFGVES
ncbi:MAG: DUF1573 domain-containing protein [Thermoguttaceae bacterium]|nr:DUF1573 domain-containing protein [Thermoguttaceae bacterium]